MKDQGRASNLSTKMDLSIGTVCGIYLRIDLFGVLCKHIIWGAYIGA